MFIICVVPVKITVSIHSINIYVRIKRKKSFFLKIFLKCCLVTIVTLFTDHILMSLKKNPKNSQYFVISLLCTAETVTISKTVLKRKHFQSFPSVTMATGPHRSPLRLSCIFFSPNQNTKI